MIDPLKDFDREFAEAMARVRPKTGMKAPHAERQHHRVGGGTQNKAH